MEKILALLLSFVIFFSIVMSVGLFPRIDVSPSVGISECPGFNSTFNPFNASSCKIYPGSLLFVVSSNNPFGFKYSEKHNHYVYFLPFLLVMILVYSVYASYFLTKRNYKKTLLSISYALLTAFVFYLIALFSGSTYSKGDVMCYQYNDYYVCHTLIEKTNTSLILRGSANSFNDTVGVSSVRGKVVAKIPFLGALAYALYDSYEVYVKTLEIIFKGYYPQGVYVRYYTW